MLTYEKALIIAERYLKTGEGDGRVDLPSYQGLDLRRIHPQGRKEMPHKYRFAYDLYVAGMRVRGRHLVLDVDRADGAITIQRNRIVPEHKTITMLLQQLMARRQELLIEDFYEFEARAYLLAHFSKVDYLSVETAEAIIDLTLPTAGVGHNAWRFEINLNIGQNSFYKKVYIYKYFQPKDGETYKLVSEKGVQRAGGWKIQNVTHERNKKHNRKLLRYRFYEKTNDPPRLDWLSRQQSHATVTTCFFFLDEWLARHGFLTDLQDIKVKMVRFAGLGPGGAHFRREGSTPTLVFLWKQKAKDDARGFSWADDPSIVLHEMGHALRDIFFVTANPAFIAGTRIDFGIEEGFCDYISATLSRDDHHLDTHSLKKRYVDLLRFIGVIEDKANHRRRVSIYPPDLKLDGASLHEVGSIWACFLWHLRALAGVDVTDSLILRTYLDPDLNTTINLDNAANALKAYFQDLRHKSAEIDEFTLTNEQWQQLYDTHLKPHIEA